ncbi:MAG: hypothetical protein AMXMBFR4_26320 [Candidatus Hydrogenedentota bacterium]
MATFYLVCAGVGATILIIQFLLALVGFDHHGVDGADFHGDMSIDASRMDAGHATGDHGHGNHGDVESSVFLKMLSIRALISATAFFGLGGLAALEGGLGPWLAFGTACGAGLVAMYIVAWMMRAHSSLHAEGNVHVEYALGATGTVYLSIPGQKSGMGKVQVNVQNRTMEYEAITAGDALPTGAPVIVVGIINDETVEVRSVSDIEESK